MYCLPPSVGALALLTVDIMGQYPPASPPGPEFTDQSLYAFSVLIHGRRCDGTLTFRLETGVISLSTTGRAVVDNLEDALTDVGVLAAYDLYGYTLPVIADVARPGKHVGLMALANDPAVQLYDLSDQSRSADPISFDAAANAAGIATVPAADIARLQWWNPGGDEQAIAVVTAQAIATWRLWLHRHTEKTGNPASRDYALGQLEKWLEANPLPLVDRLGGPLPEPHR